MMRRRHFVIALGTGVGASIVGYFGYRQPPHFESDGATKHSPEHEHLPSLRADVVFGRLDDQVTVSRGEPDNPVICAANELGAAILERLDGRHTIEQISESLAMLVTASPNRPLEAKVALFVAQLATHGFLAEPFYTTIYETVEDR
jgi:hypothetical protein